MKPFYVYILKCNDGSYYTGHTDDIEKRLAEHQNPEKITYTTTRLPVEIVYLQEFATRVEAIAAERQIQGWSRKKKEALIQNDWDQLIKLSNTKNHASTQASHKASPGTQAYGPLVLNEVEGSARTE